MSKVYSLGMYRNIHPANVGADCARELSQSALAEITTKDEVFIIRTLRLTDNKNGIADMYVLDRDNPIQREWDIGKNSISDVLTAFLIMGSVITVR